jgi:23S rRNA (guanosine2251-2'-O)-methyltransferase
MRTRGNRRPDRPRGGSGSQAIVYGWHSAVAALRNPRRRVQKIYATGNALQRLAELGIPELPDPADAGEIDRVTGAGAVHQGIALVCDPLPELDLADLEDARLIVVLDQVTDPHNVGAILRSAAAFGAKALVLTERHGPADSGLLAKAASGGIEHVALVRVKNLARALAELGEMGFLRLGFDSEHADPLQEFRAEGKLAVVLGAEGKGMRRLTREHCDRLVRLDMPGPIKSLNVSNAAAVALYEVTRPDRAEPA